MNLDFATIPALIVLCVLIGELVKVTPLDTKFIPVVCGVSGAALGGLAYGINMPAMLALADDPITAVAIGVASGLAATGAHQVIKQLKDKSDKNALEE